jgi:hypothetical protein
MLVAWEKNSFDYIYMCVYMCVSYDVSYLILYKKCGKKSMEKIQQVRFVSPKNISFMH